MTKKDILKRMNYLIGHLAGVKKMIESEAYCVDIITQNLGVISALRKVNLYVLKKHFDTCLLRAMRGKSPEERGKKTKELLKIFAQIK